MRSFISRGALTALLVVATPVAILSAARPALAQQDKITELARAKFMDGVAAFDTKRYGEARDLFLQAYAMKRHPAVLLNLGLAEIRVGDVDAGANHLQQFLREFEQATPQQRQNASAGIAEAKKSSAYIISIVDTDGAVVMVDGQVVGQSPLTDPVFVKPGEHDVEARANGRGIRVKVQAKVGAMASAQLNLKTGVTEAVPMTEGASPQETPKKPKKAPEPESTEEPEQPEAKTDESNRWSNDLPPPDSGPYMNPGYNAPSAFGTSQTPQDTSAVTRPGFIPWLKEKPAALATLSIGGGLGLLGTIGFGAGAASAKGSASDVTNAIVAQTQNPSDASGQLPASYYTAQGSPIPCGTLDDPNSAHPYYRDACDQLRSNLKAYDTDIALMWTSIVLTTLSVGGTYAWYYLDTDKKPDAKPGEAKPPQAFLTIAPILSTREQGLGLVGTF